MRIRAAARGITAVNPDVTGTLKRSTGFNTAADGSRTPTFSSSTGKIQVQGLTAKELMQLEGQNLGDVLRKVYLDGSWDSVARQQVRGGDQFIFDSFLWKVVQDAEQWVDWTAVIVAQIAPYPAP